MVHRSILRMWKTGFHCRNRGFHSPESRFPVAGLKGTFQPEYSKGIKNLQIKILQRLQGLKSEHIKIGEERTFRNYLRQVYEFAFICYEVLLWKIMLGIGKIKKKGSGQCYLIGSDWVNIKDPARFTFKRAFFSGEMKKYCFEDASFTSMENAHDYLSAFYGDYMTPKKYSHIGDTANIDFGDFEV